LNLRYHTDRGNVHHWIPLNYPLQKFTFCRYFEIRFFFFHNFNLLQYYIPPNYICQSFLKKYFSGILKEEVALRHRQAQRRIALKKFAVGPDFIGFRIDFNQGHGGIVLHVCFTD